MIKKFSTPFLAFLQTTGFVIYVILISSFFTFLTPHIPEKTIEGKFFIPIIMLILFVFSAVTSAILILGRSGVLFWEKKYKECFQLVLWTVGWGFVYFVIFVSYLLLLMR